MGAQSNWPYLNVFVPGYQFERVALEDLDAGDAICARTLPHLVTVGGIKFPNEGDRGVGTPVLIEFIVNSGSVYYRWGASFRLTPTQAERYYRLV